MQYTRYSWVPLNISEHAPDIPTFTVLSSSNSVEKKKKNLKLTAKHGAVGALLDVCVASFHAFLSLLGWTAGICPAGEGVKVLHADIGR